MVYLNNINKSGTFLKNKNSFSGDNQTGLVEGFVALGVLAGVTIFLFVGFCKLIQCVMLVYDSNNPAEEFPLQQGIMNGAIPNNRNDNIEIPLMAKEAEDWL